MYYRRFIFELIFVVALFSEIPYMHNMGFFVNKSWGVTFVYDLVVRKSDFRGRWSAPRKHWGRSKKTEAPKCRSGIRYLPSKRQCPPPPPMASAYLVHYRQLPGTLRSFSSPLLLSPPPPSSLPAARAGLTCASLHTCTLLNEESRGGGKGGGKGGGGEGGMGVGGGQARAGCLVELTVLTDGRVGKAFPTLI